MRKILYLIGKSVRPRGTAILTDPKVPVDQGTEFVSRDLDLWAYQRGVTLDFSRPGKPTDNAFKPSTVASEPNVSTRIDS